VVASSLSASRFTVGQVEAYLAPRIYQPNRRVVVYCHGAGANGAEIVGGTLVPAVRILMRVLVNAGYIVVAPTQTNLWGNPTSDSRMDDAVTWARANLAASSEPPVIVGASHGACCSMLYDTDNDVACQVMLIPALDTQYLRVNSPVEGIAVRAPIDAAWGVTYPAALPAGANPIDLTPQSPVQIWAASDDDISTNVQSWATTHGQEFHNVGALGHSDASIAAATPASVLTFIQQYTN
jgi:dienelactone hydrolase